MPGIYHQAMLRIEHLELLLRDVDCHLARTESDEGWKVHENKALRDRIQKELMPLEGDSLGDEVRRPSGSPSGVERKNSPGATE